MSGGNEAVRGTRFKAKPVENLPPSLSIIDCSSGLDLPVSGVCPFSGEGDNLVLQIILTDKAFVFGRQGENIGESPLNEDGDGEGFSFQFKYESTQISADMEHQLKANMYLSTVKSFLNNEMQTQFVP